MDFEIRQDRAKPQGRKKLARERAAYFQLMEQGYSVRDAARIVGIDARTGRKWRNGHHAPGNGRKAVPSIYPGFELFDPVEPEEPPYRPSRYLQERDRIHIADRLREGASIRQIAAELGRSPSTISREIRRNRHPMPRGGWTYRPHLAQTPGRPPPSPAPRRARSAATRCCGTSSRTT